MQIRAPYLLFIGDATDELSIKMAKGVADWRPELCLGEMKAEGGAVSTGLTQLTIEQAADHGAKSMILGFANSGGVLEEKWYPYIVQALSAGMDVVSGLHEKMADVGILREAAIKYGRQLHDIRHPKHEFSTGTGVKRKGYRLLTVGTDCSVGKMYTSLSLEKVMKAQGMAVDFRATGQSGILIAGNGVAIDCVVADFISGAVESLSPNNLAGHWDIIEGQGSLSHPAFAGVSLGLLHGAQPDALVICHALNRSHMRGIPESNFPSLAETIALNIQAAKLTNSQVKVVGIAVNTSSVTEDEAQKVCAEIANEFELPCVDPLRHGTEAIVERLQQEFL